MTREWIIDIASCLFAVLLLIWTADIREMRRMWTSFLTMQAITWSIGMLLVNYHLTEYPVRLFSHATRQNFISGYFIYPCITVVYNQRFPRSGRVSQLLYITAYAAAIALWDYLMATYTYTVNHLNWGPVQQFLLAFVSLLACRWFVTWMFKKDFPVRSLDDVGY